MLVAAGQLLLHLLEEKNVRDLCLVDGTGDGRKTKSFAVVLPEPLLARDDHDADLSVKSTQLLEGEFLGRFTARK